MKLIFMSPNKASLSLIKACDVDKIEINKWIGPRAFIHCWGYPKIYNLSKKAYDKKITNMFVLEDGRPIGVIHIHDLLNNGVA